MVIQNGMPIRVAASIKVELLGCHWPSSTWACHGELWDSSGDEIAQIVGGWEGGNDVAVRTSKPFRLRLEVRNSDIFSSQHKARPADYCGVESWTVISWNEPVPGSTKL